MSDLFPQDVRVNDDVRAKYWADRLRNAMVNAAPGPGTTGRVLHLNPFEYHNLMTTPSILLNQFLDPNVIGVAAGTDVTILVDEVWEVGALKIKVIR